MKTLIIEDSEADAELILRELRKYFGDTFFKRVSSSSELKEVLSSEWDIILSDYNMPGFGALEALNIIQSEGIPTPFIVISGAVGEETAAEIMKAGAEDLILKSKLFKLGPIIERSLKEASIRRSEVNSKALAEKAVSDREQMLEIVTHDLKNPLSAMRLNIQLIQRLFDSKKLGESETQIQKLLLRIRRSTEVMESLIANILDVSKMESGKFILEKTLSNPAEIISDVLEVCEPIASQKSIILRAEVDANFESCFDKDRVFQVLSNLVSNSLKFTQNNGEIIVSLVRIPTGLRFSVRDNGCGIPSTDLPYIFDRFWQAKRTQKSGTGLGLAISQGIVAAHQGQIWVNSEEGKGTTVYFTINEQDKN